MSGHRAAAIAICIKRILKVTIHLPVRQKAAHRAAVIHQKVVAVHPVEAVHPVVAVRPVAAVHPAVKIIHQRKAVLQVHLLLTVNGYEDIYENDDFDEDRYRTDSDYASGVDDAMEDVDW